MKTALALIAFPIVIGCTTTAVVGVGGGETNLNLLNNESTREELVIDEASGLAGYTKAAEVRIGDLCTESPIKEDQRALLPTIIIPFVVEPLVGYALNKVEEKLKSEMEKYLASYAAGVTPDYFYTTTPLTGENAMPSFGEFDSDNNNAISILEASANDYLNKQFNNLDIDNNSTLSVDEYSVLVKPKLAWNCFRFTRQVTKKDENGKSVKDENNKNVMETAIDIVGQFRMVQDGGALQIRPLRLYYAIPKANGSEFGLSANLKAHSTWREENIGNSSDTFDYSIISGKITKLPTIKYYSICKANKASGECELNEKMEKDWSSYSPVSLVPWSSDSTHKTGNARLTLTVGEAGNAPKHLELISGVFSDKKDDIGTLINDALTKLLGADTEDQN